MRFKNLQTAHLDCQTSSRGMAGQKDVATWVDLLGDDTNIGITVWNLMRTIYCTAEHQSDFQINTIKQHT